VKRDLEAVFIFGLPHLLQAVGHTLGVAVGAPGADPVAPGDRVPGGAIGVDLGGSGHRVIY